MSQAGEVLDAAPEWVGPFVSELRSFTGINDKHDDQVDALAAAYEPAARAQVSRRVAHLPPG
jgi:phage terminase large subunit-like protein